MQEIVSLAKEADPDGSRTIGVVTKVDMLEEGTHDSWRDVFSNTGPVRLKLGYQFLRNPTPQELTNGISSDQAVRNEEEFFRTDPYFSRRAPFAMAGRCGVDVLRGALSKVLIELIHRELPEMRKAVEEALAKVRACAHACHQRQHRAAHAEPLAWSCCQPCISCC